MDNLGFSRQRCSLRPTFFPWCCPSEQEKQLLQSRSNFRGSQILTSQPQKKRLRPEICEDMDENRNVAAVAVIILAAFGARGQELDAIPSDLTFGCEGRPYGYYADRQANCQVFHICLGEGDVKWSFLCPNHTIFNQQYFVCDYAVNVDCQLAELYYDLNENFGKIPLREDDGDDVVEDVTTTAPKG